MSAAPEPAAAASAPARRAVELPRLIIDTREQLPLSFPHLEAVRGTLTTGDYSLEGLESKVMFERKSWPDFVNSVTNERERFWRELERMRAASCRRLFIIGTHAELKACLDRRRVTIDSVLGSMAAIDARFCPVVRVDTPERAAAIIERLAVYLWADEARPFLGRVEIPAWARDGILKGGVAV